MEGKHRAFVSLVAVAKSAVGAVAAIMALISDNQSLLQVFVMSLQTSRLENR